MLHEEVVDTGPHNSHIKYCHPEFWRCGIPPVIAQNEINWQEDHTRREGTHHEIHIEFQWRMFILKFLDEYAIHGI